MKIYTVKVLDASRMSSRTYQKMVREVKAYHKKHLGVTLRFDRDRVRLPNIQTTALKRTVSPRTGKVIYKAWPRKDWFRRHFTSKADGYDFVFGIVSDTDWKKENPQNALGGQSIDLYNNISENFVVNKRGYRKLDKDGKRYPKLIATTIHEFGHSWPDHIIGNPQLDFTHIFHYRFENMSGYFSLLKKYL